jgi:DNA polymerase/3'-5' exonuclease PolX
MNTKLIELLTILRDSADGYRSRAFDIAMISIAELPYDAASELPRLRRDIANKVVRGIGKGIMERIEEFALTGRINEADIIAEDRRAIAELCSIKGVGKKTARIWIAKGIRTLVDVRRAIGKSEIEPTLAQKYGILYYGDLLERIPRREIEEFAIVVKNIIPFKWRHFDIVGSYRRGGASSGDVDILVDVAKVNSAMIDRIEELISIEDYYLETLSKGEHSITFLYKFNGKVKQCDILLTSDYIPALVYFTGSKEHCIMLRKQAKRMNMTLNQYGLYHDDKKIALKDERDLYAKLKLEYVSPDKR